MNRLIKTPFNKTIIATIIANLAVSSAVFAQETNTKNVDKELEVIEVVGQRSGLIRSIDDKRNADQVSDVINADDIGKLPDLNVAESLSRVTGVQVTNGQDVSPGDATGMGEGSSVSIRGIRPDMNKATVNGHSMGTTTGGRSFDFNALAPELVSRIEVFKTPTADMTEGAIGGAVNLVTHSPLEIGKQKLVGSVKYTQHELGSNDGTKFSGLYSNVFADGTLGLLASFYSSSDDKRRDRYENFGWGEKTFEGQTAFMPEDIRWHIREEEQDRQGGNVVLEWQPQDELNLSVNHIFSALDTHQRSSQPILKFRRAKTIDEASLDDNGNFIAAAISDHRGWTGWNKIAYFDRAYKTETSTTFIDAEWVDDSWNLSGALGKTAGDWRQNPSVFTQFQQNVDLSYDYSQGTLPLLNTSSMSGDELYSDPSTMKLSVLSIADKSITDDEDFAQIDFTYFIDNSLFTAVQMGAKYRNRINATSSLIGKLAPADRSGFTMDQFLVDPYTDFEHAIDGGATSNIPDFSTQLIMDGPGGLISDLSEEGKWTENWSIEEKTTAAYILVDLEGENYRANFGVRYVETGQANNGHNADGTEAPFSRTYSDTLPSANITYDVNDDFIIRAGYAKTMARPSMADLNNGATINEGAGTIKKGNAELDPFRADQFDLSAEWYFEEGGLISAALFHKDIESFVTGTQYDVVVSGEPDPETGENGDRMFLVTSLENGDGATVTGLELSHQQNYTFLPGLLSGLGTLVNYTYTASDTNLKDADGMDRNLPMPGLSEHTINAIIFYQYENFSSRIAYNYRDKFVTFADGLGGLPIYRNDVSKLDMSVTYKVPNSSLAFIFAATNITDEETHDYAGSEERLIAYHSTGRHFGLSVRYNFL